MRPRRALWIGYWAAARLYWALTGVAILLAAAVAAPPLLYVAIAGAVIVVAGLVTDIMMGPRLHEVSVHREPPQAYALGVPATIAYRISNGSPREVRLHVMESPTALLEMPESDLPVRVAPRTHAVAHLPVLPVTRGTAQLQSVFVTAENAIGLVRRRLRLTQPCSVRVYPDLSAVARYGTLHARNKLLETGLRRMRLRGTGTETESVREWAAGDPFRAMNWKATARRGRMMVSEYEVERSQNVMILLDAGRLMVPRVKDRQKFDYAIAAALSVATVASFANDKVGAIAFAAEILRAAAPRSGGRNAAALVQAFHGVTPVFEETDYDRAFSYVRGHVHKRSLIIFFTDMVDPVAQGWMFAGLATLCRRHVVICAFMNDGAIEDTLTHVPAGVQDVFAAGVALELRDERRAAARRLEHLGVNVLDVPAAELTTALIDAYMRIKERGLL